MGKLKKTTTITQTVEVSSNGEFINAKVLETIKSDTGYTDTYTWVLQGMELKTAITLVDKLTEIINAKRFG